MIEVKLVEVVDFNDEGWFEAHVEVWEEGEIEPQVTVFTDWDAAEEFFNSIEVA